MENQSCDPPNGLDGGDSVPHVSRTYHPGELRWGYLDPIPRPYPACAQEYCLHRPTGWRWDPIVRLVELNSVIDPLEWILLMEQVGG